MVTRKMKTRAFLKSRNERKRVEMRFGHLKTHHSFERMRLRDLTGARVSGVGEVGLVALGACVGVGRYQRPIEKEDHRLSRIEFNAGTRPPRADFLDSIGTVRARDEILFLKKEPSKITCYRQTRIPLHPPKPSDSVCRPVDPMGCAGECFRSRDGGSVVGSPRLPFRVTTITARLRCVGESAVSPEGQGPSFRMCRGLTCRAQRSTE